MGDGGLRGGGGLGEEDGWRSRGGRGQGVRGGWVGSLGVVGVKG